MSTGKRGKPKQQLSFLDRLSDTDKRLETILGTIPSGVVIIEKPDGRVSFINRRARELYGQDPTGVEMERHSTVLRLLRPDGSACPAGELPASRALLTGEVIRNQEIIIEHATGKRLTVLASAAPLFDESGEVIAAVGTFEDITLRKRAEKALAQEIRLRQIAMENTGAHLAYLDPDFNFTLVNSTYSRNCGYRPEELIGKNHFDLFPDHENQAIFERVRDTGEPAVAHDKPFVFPNQPERGVTYWDWSLTPVKDASGRVEGLVLSLVETTERVRAGQYRERILLELEAANKELEAFSYSVSHDLRAPLRSMEGFSQALLEDYADKLDEQGRDFLSRIQASSQLMAQLIDDLLKLARVTRYEMHWTTVDLSELAREIIAGYRSKEPERKVELVVAPGLKATGDARLLRLAMENLLGNAWKFTGKKECARIEVGRFEHEGKPAFFVSDNGAGFDTTYADKLFQPFQRLHRSHEFPGTGIGLATVQRIIRRHGGRAWGEGRLGEGATFYFTLS